MAHTHPVRDTDPKFTIDPITRQVSSIDNKKYTLMQYDHNSERYTFELDRWIEEHDMLLCNKIELHYINTSSSGEKQPGVYEIDDFTVSDESEDKVVFTWLVSENATMYAGNLSFLILFACVENDEITYRWHTGINSSIIVSSGMNNGEAVTEPYPDILAEWKADLFSRNYAYEGAVKNGFEGTEEEWYEEILIWAKSLAIWRAKQNKLTWVTDEDIDAMFEGTYEGEEDESAEGYYPSYEVVGENLVIENGVSIDG